MKTGTVIDFSMSAGHITEDDFAQGNVRPSEAMRASASPAGHLIR